MEAVARSANAAINKQTRYRPVYQLGPRSGSTSESSSRSHSPLPCFVTSDTSRRNKRQTKASSAPETKREWSVPAVVGEKIRERRVNPLANALTQNSSINPLPQYSSINPLIKPKIEEPTEEPSTPLFRPNVAAIVFNKEGKVLCGERSDFIDQSYWQFPQGGIDKEEDLVTAAKREVEEEMGVPTNYLIPLPDQYQIPTKFRYSFKQPVLKDGVIYDGQEQRFVLFLFVGDEMTFDLKEGQKEQEFRRVEWKNLSELIPTVLPSKVDIYRTISNLVESTCSTLFSRPCYG
eukprot:TRINITY_DN12770_c0_g1_i5.p1 TRINITY_DN12770_c0_g1~~TRINITY_DN12770_c0_g1_i5.p1  ORF type:complete len:309 (-),score=60.69 TRINITY_DN12770_c0_g1_i5:225-1097(-)